MGKGTILSHLGAGRYSMTVNYARAAIDARITKLTGKINTAFDVSEQADAVAVEKQAVYDAAVADLDVEIAKAREALIAISPVSPAVERAFLEEQAALAAATAVVITAEAELAKARFAASLALLDFLALYHERKRLQAVPEDYDTIVWCADHNEHLSGEVGTLEINGQETDHGSTTSNILIAPGGVLGANAVYNQAVHGQLMPVLAMSPAETFYNTAMRPGWQKWRPTFRRGVVTAAKRVGLGVDDTRVTLDEAANEMYPYLDINTDANSAPGIAVECDYLERDHEAVCVGDRVIVEFTGQDPDIPTIIGFEEWPPQCALRSDAMPGGVLTVGAWQEIALGFGRQVLDSWIPAGEDTTRILSRDVDLVYGAELNYDAGLQTYAILRLYHYNRQMFGGFDDMVEILASNIDPDGGFLSPPKTEIAVYLTYYYQSGTTFVIDSQDMLSGYGFGAYKLKLECRGLKVTGKFVIGGSGDYVLGSRTYVNPYGVIPTVEVDIRRGTSPITKNVFFCADYKKRSL